MVPGYTGGRAAYSALKGDAMDPDVTLEKIQEALNKAQAAPDDEAALAYSEEAAILFSALDKWLTTGGSLPAVWDWGRSDAW